MRSLLLGALFAAVAVGCGRFEPERAPTGAGEVQNLPSIGEPDDLPSADDPAVDPRPEVDAVVFDPDVDNPYFPLVPGETFLYVGVQDGEEIRIETEVTGELVEIRGVSCVVTRTREYADGELVEVTADYYAQDAEGNVWTFGEESAEYEDGRLVGTDGSWLAGEGGAEAGIVVPGDPVPGRVYRQELRPDGGEDLSRVEGLDVPLVLGDGTPLLCLQTKEWDPNDPQEIEYKYFAPGIGPVKEEAVDGSGSIELVLPRDPAD